LDAPFAFTDHPVSLQETIVEEINSREKSFFNAIIGPLAMYPFFIVSQLKKLIPLI
jgi:hypothetical protein